MSRVSGARVAWTVLKKDLLLDFRTRDRLGHMGMFALLIVALLSITLPESPSAARSWVPALMWTLVLLAALLGLARSFGAESEAGAVALLVQVPCDRGWVFLGKAGANLIALLGLELWIAVLFAVFLDVDWAAAGLQAVWVGVLGAVGLAALGTLLAGMSIAVRFREFLLPVLLFPLVLPVLVLTSRITAEALGAGAPPRLWWGALALYDWVFALIGYFVFDYVLED